MSFILFIAVISWSLFCFLSDQLHIYDRFHDTEQGYRICFLVSLFTSTNLILLSPCCYSFNRKRKQKHALLCLKPQDHLVESQCTQARRSTSRRSETPAVAIFYWLVEQSSLCSVLGIFPINSSEAVRSPLPLVETLGR